MTGRFSGMKAREVQPNHARHARNLEDVPSASRGAAADADLVYNVQRWPRRVFKEECDTGGQLSEVVASREEGYWQAFTRELFGRLYGIGTKRMEEPRTGCEWADELHNQTDAVPEWKNLEGRVNGDPWRAGLGTAAAASVLKDRIPQLPEEDVASLQAEADLIEELMTQQGKRTVNQKLLKQRGEIQKRLAYARQQAEGATEKLQEDGGMAVRSAIRSAAAAAEEALDEIEGGLDGLGVGTGAGNAQRRAVAQKLAENKKLREIANLAGKLRAQAAQKQRTKTNREREEVHGITTGDDLNHLLASEVGMLPKPETRTLLMSRIADKRALQYELRGRHTKTRGPIVFLIDTSGSMSGQPEVWAKAAALAMMEIARMQKRHFAVQFYNTKVVAEYRFDPANVDTARLLECLSFFSSGGTNIASALNGASELIENTKSWKPGQHADVVLISDGADNSDVGSAAERVGLAESSIYTIAIGHEPTKALKDISADVTKVDASHMRGPSDKLDTVFSI